MDRIVAFLGNEGGAQVDHIGSRPGCETEAKGHLPVPWRRDPGPDLFDRKDVTLGFAAAMGQIVLLDVVFSVDSIITAVGMTEHVPIMVIAVVVAVLTMLLAATPLSNFINANPTIVMLALGFLLMIGTALIAEGFGAKVPKGYIYAAMAFSALVEGLNMLERRARKNRRG